MYKIIDFNNFKISVDCFIFWFIWRFYIENHIFLPLFIIFSMPTCFIPDDIKVNVYKNIDFNLFLSNWKFKLFHECSCFIEYSGFSSFFISTSKLQSPQYVSVTFIVCCNRCCDRGKIAKSSAKRNKLTSVLMSAGISFFVVVTNADVNNLWMN